MKKEPELNSTNESPIVGGKKVRVNESFTETETEISHEVSENQNSISEVLDCFEVSVSLGEIVQSSEEFRDIAEFTNKYFDALKDVFQRTSYLVVLSSLEKVNSPEFKKVLEFAVNGNFLIPSIFDAVEKAIENSRNEALQNIEEGTEYFKLVVVFSDYIQREGLYYNSDIFKAAGIRNENVFLFYSAFLNGLLSLINLEFIKNPQKSINDVFDFQKLPSSKKAESDLTKLFEKVILEKGFIQKYYNDEIKNIPRLIKQIELRSTAYSDIVYLQEVHFYNSFEVHVEPEMLPDQKISQIFFGEDLYSNKVEIYQALLLNINALLIISLISLYAKQKDLYVMKIGESFYSIGNVAVFELMLTIEKSFRKGRLNDFMNLSIPELLDLLSKTNIPTKTSYNQRFIATLSEFLPNYHSLEKSHFEELNVEIIAEFQRLIKVLLQKTNQNQNIVKVFLNLNLNRDFRNTYEFKVVFDLVKELSGQDIDNFYDEILPEILNYKAETIEAVKRLSPPPAVRRLGKKKRRSKSIKHHKSKGESEKESQLQLDFESSIDSKVQEKSHTSIQKESREEGNLFQINIASESEDKSVSAEESEELNDISENAKLAETKIIAEGIIAGVNKILEELEQKANSANSDSELMKITSEIITMKNYLESLGIFEIIENKPFYNLLSQIENVRN